jgi:hypothetical protein
MERRFGKWEQVEIVLRQSAALQLSIKEKEDGSRYQVQLKLGTRHRKDSLHKIGMERAESTDCFVQFEVEVN